MQRNRYAPSVFDRQVQNPMKHCYSTNINRLLLVECRQVYILLLFLVKLSKLRLVQSLIEQLRKRRWLLIHSRWVFSTRIGSRFQHNRLARTAESIRIVFSLGAILANETESPACSRSPEDHRKWSWLAARGKEILRVKIGIYHANVIVCGPD